MKPQLILLAGPNGAGKSTFYELYLRTAELPFLNADLVAARTGIDAFSAARLLDALRDRMIDEGQGFITETVFSDRGGEKLTMLRKAVDRGYAVTLIYIGIASPALSELRVIQRTALGGHDVPRDKLGPRFARSLANLEAALEVVPEIKIYDNSSPEEPYRLIATLQDGAVVQRIRGAAPAWIKKILPRKR